MNTSIRSAEKPTINDVAELAGVSIKTVSRVANKSPHVSDHTRQKVQQVIDQLEYRANPHAKLLGSWKPPAKKAMRMPKTPLPGIAKTGSAQVAKDIDWW